MGAGNEGWSMRFYRDLYLTENLKKKKYKMMWKLKTGSGMVDVYVITLAANGRDLLDIMNSSICLQPAVHNRLPLVIGMASGYDGALKLVQKIIEDVYNRTGTYEVRKYFEETDRRTLIGKSSGKKKQRQV